MGTEIGYFMVEGLGCDCSEGCSWEDCSGCLCAGVEDAEIVGQHYYLSVLPKLIL